MVAVVPLSLPTSFVSAITGMRWPLGIDSSLPLYYESLEGMKAIRKRCDPKTVYAAAAKDDDGTMAEFMNDIPAMVESLFPPGVNKDQRHFGLISIALILLGNGYTDECHNLVTPLSWPDDIHFAYGPSVYNQVSPEAKSLATYVHCLVHRREAFHVGEFGMVGFQNGNYWSDAAHSRSLNQYLPHNEWLSQMSRIAEEFSDCKAAQEWCHRHGMVPDTSTFEPSSSSSTNPRYFESRAVHELCAMVLQRQSAPDPVLQTFAERVVEAEMRVLLNHASPRAGFSLDCLLEEKKEEYHPVAPVISYSENGIPETIRKADEYLAVCVNRKISSAHLASFREGGSIILRRILSVGDMSEISQFSAAAGAACRLLESPAVAESRSSNDMISEAAAATVHISLRSHTIGATEQGLSDNLGVGDLHASRSQLLNSNRNIDGIQMFCFRSVGHDDPVAVFVDPFYGAQGETPTTVVQWSKGTIF